jgi:hypothetical protein
VIEKRSPIESMLVVIIDPDSLDLGAVRPQFTVAGQPVLHQARE